MPDAVPNLDRFIDMERRAFAAYLAAGAVTLIVAAGVLAATFSTSLTGAPSLALKSSGFLVAVLSVLPFERCLARHERVNNLLRLRTRCEELAADPDTPGPDAAWVEGLIERLFEKRLLG